MKRLFTVILATVLCFTLTSCAKKSQDVKNTEVMIRAIGTVTDQSGEDIVTAEKFYNGLTEEEKGQVSNYSTLTQARETYNGLILYGQWMQYGVEDSVVFTLAEDGTFTTTDGDVGTYENTDSQVIMKFKEGTVTLNKEMDRNLLHLKTDHSDYIRPDLLTVDRAKIVSSSWHRYFDINYHLHIEKDDFGMATDYWNCYVMTPNEKYAGFVAPETEVTVTFDCMTNQIVTIYSENEDTLLIAKELTEPAKKSVTVTLPAEAFTQSDCCNAEYDIIRGVSGPYENFKLTYKTFERLDYPEVVSFEGMLYYYDQLVD